MDTRRIEILDTEAASEAAADTLLGTANTVGAGRVSEVAPEISAPSGSPRSPDAYPCRGALPAALTPAEAAYLAEFRARTEARRYGAPDAPTACNHGVTLGRTCPTCEHEHELRQDYLRDLAADRDDADARHGGGW